MCFHLKYVSPPSYRHILILPLWESSWRENRAPKGQLLQESWTKVICSECPGTIVFLQIFYRWCCRQQGNNTGWMRCKAKSRQSELLGKWDANGYLYIRNIYIFVKNYLTTCNQSHHSAHSLWSSNAASGDLILGNMEKSICMEIIHFSAIYNSQK